MVDVLPIFKKAYWSLAAAGGLYAILVLCLTNTWLQRHALYAHRLHSGWWHNVSEPESFGFAKNQVTPFNITTLDGEVLYAWHVLPLHLYAKHEEDIRAQPSGLVDDFSQTVAGKLLIEDSESRVIVNFHGNAGHVAQGWRTDTYRSLTALSSATAPIHLLTIDYRGFGRSTGAPTEAGLITDGTALVSYVLHTLGVPASRVVIVGQSLGTAVASAVALEFAKGRATPANGTVDGRKSEAVERQPGADFAGVVLVAPFTSLPTLLLTYRIAGLVPILSPLRPYPRLQALLRGRIADKWDTAGRMGEWVRTTAGLGRRMHLHIIHSVNDYDIPWRHSEELFYVAANASSDGGIDRGRWEGLREVTRMEEEEGAVERWKVGEGREVLLEIVRHGGHNRIVTYAPVALAVLKAFELP